MLRYFIRPLKDELWYSILCRCSYFFNLNSKEFLKLIGKTSFPKTTLIGEPDYQIYSNTFGYNFDFWLNDIQNKHTLLPSLKTFINPKKLQDLEKANKLPSSIYRFNNESTIKYCPKCIRERKKATMHYYFTVTEQLWGYLVCPKHEIPLKFLKLPIWNNGIGLININDLIKDKSKTMTYPISSFLSTYKRLSAQAVKIFKNQNLLLSVRKNNINSFYLGDANYYDWNVLSDHLQLYYGQEFLKNLKKIYDELSLDSEYLRKEFSSIKYIYNPILLLLIYDFFENLELYPQNIIEKKRVFTKENQECINKTCDYFGEKTAKLQRIKSRSSNNLIGYFKCNQCHMLYSLSYFTNKSLSKSPRIIEFGTLFIDQLKIYVKEDIIISRIKNLLGIHETTIIKLVDDLNLTYNYWDDIIKKNKRLQVSIKLVNDLIESEIKISKARIFSHYKNHLDYIRFYDRKSYKKIIAKL